MTLGIHTGLRRSYFRFFIHKAIREVLILGVLDQRSNKGLILNDTEFSQILDIQVYLQRNFESISNEQTYTFRFKSELPNIVTEISMFKTKSEKIDYKIHDSCNSQSII